MRKIIHNLSDLTEYGFNVLTGEACTYSMRILVDLNERGVDILGAFLGSQFEEGALGNNWNSEVYGEPAAASVMLTHSTLRDLSIFVLLYTDGFPMVVDTGDDIYGLTDKDDVKTLQNMHPECAVFYRHQGR